MITTIISSHTVISKLVGKLFAQANMETKAINVWLTLPKCDG